MADSNSLQTLLSNAKNKWGQDVVTAIKEKIQQDQLIWQGELLDSITFTQADDEIDFNMADYGKYQDEGTGTFGPTKIPIPKESIPGIAYFITPWALEKGLSPWGVAAAMVKKGGLKPRPFFKSTIEVMIPELNVYLDEAYNDFLDEVMTSVNK